jgi:hypothetical protein
MSGGWLTIVLLFLFCWACFRKQRRIERRRPMPQEWRDNELIRNATVQLAQADRERLAALEKRLDEVLKQQNEDILNASLLAPEEAKIEYLNSQYGEKEEHE